MAYKLQTLEDGSGLCVGTIIRFETVTILLDPAWSNTKISYEKAVTFWSTIIPDVDIILISQSTADCLGAYPLLFFNFLSHFISRIHVYATLPITNLGRVATIDLYVSGGIAGPYESNEMDIEDIESAFDFIEALKFSQDVDLRSRYDGLSMTAYNSGYSPGSSIWCITNYSEKLLYARNWNHSKSTILNAAALLDSSGKSLSALTRPSSVITSLTHFGSSRPLKRRVNMYNEALRKALVGGGSVIIPCEIGGNFLDLLAMTHNFLYERSNNGKQSKVPILLVSYAKGRTVTYAQSMLEWLSSSVIKKWENRNGRSPFDVNSILKPVTPKEVLKQKGPAICFVSEVDSCISETMKNIAEISNVTVLLTSNRENNQPVLDKMKGEWLEQSSGKLQEGTNISYSTTAEFEIVNLKPLKDESLTKFNDRIDRRRKERKEEEIALRKESKLSGSFAHSFGEGQGVLNNENDGTIGSANNDDDDEDDEDDDDLIDILKGKGKNNKVQEIPMDTIISSNSSIKNRMFHFKPVKHKIDEYGSFVNIDQFLPKEEDGQNENSVGNQKRYVGDDEDENGDSYDALNRSKKQKKDKQKEKENEERKKKEKMKFDNLEYLDAKNHPCLRTFQKDTATISCQLSFINLDNIVDQRSTSVIWPTLKPRKIILLGSKDMQDENVMSILNKREIEIVNIPYNENVEFDTIVKTLDISLDVELDQSLRWQRIGEGHTVAHVIGKLVKEAPSQKSGSTRSKLVLKPITNSNKRHTNGSLSIGDVRLVEVRRKLLELNHKAEFKGEGTLVVDGQVAVRKVSDGETVINGFPSDIFDTVKSTITDMLAKV
ncbi:similar to Saccharomyces cerevisiae YLR115W CFT2 Subunit of the mRNA cleavage and polyadenlylation factor (CPF) [Maudiozyma saulgeensis]|uniref:Cleavage and polyadenylation specificity factor subunit 2 n=1 Tax=Maudiozyma saulgeensis TaxID=1789683 RepID=A0A1X7R850_9SACH|nr:similar to Saccharomyces cerevisiae YLR115W CFT2 Subunit of the mRNA cleavage and polyadenlylation factor (CPF) [Kazachstania saulgeensis]